MSYRKDKIFDILAVLGAMRKSSGTGTTFLNIKEIRIQSINEVAKAEFEKGRYKNMYSAYKTIIDACTRRLKPDINSIFVFDILADKWIHRNSAELKEILLKHSRNSYQKNALRDFFNRT